MLRILGDIHSQVGVLKRAAEDAHRNGASALIQLGDFGWASNTIVHFKNNPLPLPVYAIDGNHEHFESIDYDVVTEVAPNLFYVPRGTVMELDGRKIAFMGGASSVDKAYRLANGWHWSEKENITPEQFARLDDVKSVDLLITHVPPQSVIEAHFDRADLWNYFRLPRTWNDPNAELVQTLWDRLGMPEVISGHMHASKIGHNYRILAIDEVIDI